MGKKRRVWRIVGALGAALTLFAGVAYFLYDNPDARTERAIAQLLEDYGFELVPRSPIRMDETKDSQEFVRSSVSPEDSKEIVGRLKEIFPAWSYSTDALDENRELVSVSGGDPFWVFHFFRPDVIRPVGMRIVTFCPDDHGLGSDFKKPIATINLLRLERPSTWERIRGLLP